MLAAVTPIFIPYGGGRMSLANAQLLSQLIVSFAVIATVLIPIRWIYIKKRDGYLNASDWTIPVLFFPILGACAGAAVWCVDALLRLTGWF